MSPVSFFKCLADETRLKSLLLIQQEEELCVCELTAALEQSQPKVSRHLAQLRKSGLVQDLRRGQWIFYRLSPDLPPWAFSVIEQTASANAIYINEELGRLLKMGERPDRSKLCC